MAGTSGSTHADPRHDGGAVSTVAEDPLAAVEDALARLVRETYAPTSDLRADPRFNPSADLKADPRDAASAPRSRRKPGPLAYVAIMIGLGTAAIGAWRATAPPPIAASAQAASQARSPPRLATAAANAPGAAAAEPRLTNTTAHTLADLRRAVGELAAAQKQLLRRMGKLEAEKPNDEPAAEKPDKRMPRHASAPPVSRVAARKPAKTTPLPRPAPRRVSMVYRPSPPPRSAPQMHSEARLAEPPLRPPSPVPQP